MTVIPNKRTFPVVFVVLLSAILVLVLAAQALAAPTASEKMADVPSSTTAVGGFCDLNINTVGPGTVSVSKTSEDPFLKVTVAEDWSIVTMENSQILVRFKKYITDREGVDVEEFAIQDFVIKSAGQDQVREYMEADSGRGALIDLSVIDDPDQKTVRFKWAALSGGTIEHEYTIYPNSPFLKVNYLDIKKGLALIDLAEPGGSRTEGKHVAYGGETWIRDYVYLYNDPNSETTAGSYYNRYPGDGVNDPENGGSLNYNGHFIFGNYNVNNGLGYGRVFPVKDISIIKLLLTPKTARGFELYPYPFFKPHNPFVGYLFAITGGADEAIDYGKRLADSGGTDFGYQCGDEVQLTANPDEGSMFEGWSGDLSGMDNPETITLTGKHEVTANFSASEYELNVSIVPSDGSGGSVAISPNKPVYEVDEVVQLTANPQLGWSFAGWSGDLSGTELVKNVTMDADKDITATFTQDEYTVNVTAVGGGTVQVEPEKSVYLYGDQVKITAVPGSTNSFLKAWGGDLAPFGITNPINLTVEDDINAVAIFDNRPPEFLIYFSVVLSE